MRISTAGVRREAGGYRSAWVGSRAALVVALVLLAGVVVLPAPAQAERERSCSYGEAAALFEALPPLFTFKPREDPDGYPDCQFRLFLDGETVTFTEDDWFLAGAVYFLPYQWFGLTRDEAIEVLDTIESRLWIAEVDDGVAGDLVEQTLMHTGYRGFHSPFFGLVVYRQVGLITRLPVGEYQSVFEEVFGDVFPLDELLGDLEWRSEVIIRVLPTP
jgi:hypothetical protein